MAEEFLNVEEVATLLKLRPVTIYRWCRAGRLAAVKIGKEWRIPRATIAALLRAGGWERERDAVDKEGPMNEVSPASWALARRLLLHEAAGHSDPTATAAAASRVYVRLHTRLTGAIGMVGFATLFARAQRLAQAEFPALAQFDFTGEGATQPGTAAGTTDAATVARGVTAVVANFIGLLSAFIGEDLALRLIRDAWPGETFDHEGTGEGR